MNTISHRIVIKFPDKLVDQPIVYKLVKDYNLTFNILKAYIIPNEEGLVVLELSGDKKDYDNAIKYLKNLGVNVQPLSQDIKVNINKCTHCGACVAICPSGALKLDPETYQLKFDEDKCIACLLCIPACPVRAIEVHF